MRILLTGGTGFIGRNIFPYLNQRYEVLLPNRAELNLLDEQAVESYLEDNHIDIVVHSANPNPVKNTLDNCSNMAEDSLRIFINLYDKSNLYNRMLYFGSGAEYGKLRDIKLIAENEFGKMIPKDSYGFGKYIMNRLAYSSDNVYNLRLFGCYGPFDHESKFITHAIRCCLDEKEITIRQNCMFDYVQVFDLAKVIEYFIDQNPNYHDYNICSGVPISLYDIADRVRGLMESTVDIKLLSDGWNKEYTGDNSRFLSEMNPSFGFMSLDEGIKVQISHERKYYK